MSGKPIDSKRIPAQLKDVAAVFGQLPGFALTEEEIVGDDVNVTEEENEKEAGKDNDHCVTYDMKDQETVGKEINVDEKEKGLFRLGKRRRVFNPE